MKVEVKKITVVTGLPSVDQVYLELDLPGGLSSYSQQPLSLKFEAAPGYGASYCCAHFPGVTLEVIDVALKL